MMGLSGFPATAGARPIRAISRSRWSSPGRRRRHGCRRTHPGQAAEREHVVPVVVETVLAPNGLIGADYVAKSAPDGYTLFLATAETHAINPYIYSKLPYDLNQGFVAVAPFAINPFTGRCALAFRPPLRKNVPSWRRNLRKADNARWGIGSSSQIIME
ncbi:tripartite tricarboxylate transporter substrate-binding protein, partial [Paracandidimonas soli]|uniref:tripartite tricarboxylate transporter substrate-binding protein n=1 Tax=Paracandidimonas soli TaxID=1917182 RepID=UPI00360D0076